MSKRFKDFTLQDYFSALRVTADYFGVRMIDIVRHGRKADHVTARQALMTWLYNKLGFSTTELGILFQGRDHGTIIHGMESVDDRMATKKGDRQSLELYMKTMDNCFQMHSNPDGAESPLENLIKDIIKKELTKTQTS